MSAAVLTLDSLSIRYPGRKEATVKNVSLSVGKGQTLGVIGESGCGKSTLARCVAGLIAASNGRMLWEGRDITHLGSRQRMKLGIALQIVFQDPQGSLNPRMTVRDLIEEPLKIAGNAVTGIADRLVARVGLPHDALSNRPHEFSGGQRQRIAIARALAGNPMLLILDEPTSALDLSVQAQILNLLLDLQAEQGLGYLFITHDLSVVRHVADELAVMKDGEVVETGDCIALFENPRHAYTRQLLSQ